MLAEKLRRFYGEINTKKGKEYSKSGLLGLRAGLNRHVTSPPYNRILSIIGDKEFTIANKVLLGRIKKNRADGFG